MRETKADDGAYKKKNWARRNNRAIAAVPLQGVQVSKDFVVEAWLVVVDVVPDVFVIGFHIILHSSNIFRLTFLYRNDSGNPGPLMMRPQIPHIVLL